MRRLSFCFVCLGLTIVSCGLPDVPEGDCGNDHELGHKECQCVTSDQVYSSKSWGYMGDADYLGNCKDADREYYVELDVSDIYVCLAYKCAKKTCPEGEVPDDKRRKCIPMAVCEKPNETYDRATNSCVCDTEAHWERADDGGCRCMDGYVEIRGLCEVNLENTCDVSKEVYEPAENKCLCNAELYREGEAGECRCMSDYVEIKGQCVENVEPTCDTLKEVYDSIANRCLCNADAYWEGNAGACVCMDGYVEVGGQCMESVESTCDRMKEIYDVTSNTCLCNETGHFQGIAGQCLCAPEFVEYNGRCVEPAECQEQPGTVPVLGKCVKTGDVVQFGRYQQSEVAGAPPEPLTWRILKINDNDVLMITEKIIEQHLYNPSMLDITWETCDVRSYLNGLSAAENVEANDYSGRGFVDVAFNEEERNQIKKVTNVNADGPEEWGGTPGGNDTEDWVFLLSYDEIDAYFSSNKSLVASPTSYAIRPPDGKNNIYVCETECPDNYSCINSNCTNDGSKVDYCKTNMCTAHWWLRTPGSNQKFVGFICAGENCDGTYTSYPGLRPALYLQLNP